MVCINTFGVYTCDCIVFGIWEINMFYDISFVCCSYYSYIQCTEVYLYWPRHNNLCVKPKQVIYLLTHTDLFYLGQFALVTNSKWHNVNTCRHINFTIDSNVHFSILHLLSVSFNLLNGEGGSQLLLRF